MEQKEHTAVTEKSQVKRIVGWLSMIVAYVFGRSLGWIFLWPFFGAIVAGLIARRLARAAVQPMVPALAVQGGQVIWLLAGLVTLVFFRPPQLPVTSGGVPGLISDGLLMIGFIVWIALSPNWVSVLLASVYQAGNLAVHYLNFSKTGITEVDEKGLVMHMILDASIIGCLFWGLLNKDRKSAIVLPAPSV
jgi:hypothetical protein